jgi:riboflavin kinase/FMN adenylyltransferase
MEPPTRSVLCLGNFDGVHRAHAILLNEGKQLTRELTAAEGKTLAGVFCFIRPTVDYVFTSEGVTPVRVRGHLTTLRDKLRLFARMRLDFVCLCNFPDIRDYTPAEFISLLKESCGCVGAVCGFNHYFGRHASGTVYHLLEAFGKDRVRIQPEMKMDGLTVSSSRVRECLKHGDVETAERLLGRPYSLETAVVHGKALGRTIGFPTANQYFPARSVVPAYGVYAVRCTVDGKIYNGVANVGMRPTVDGKQARVNCETHLFDYTGDLYGKVLCTAFYTYLRPERKFESADALRAAIASDAQRARDYFENFT